MASRLKRGQKLFSSRVSRLITFRVFRRRCLETSMNSLAGFMDFGQRCLSAIESLNGKERGLVM